MDDYKTNIEHFQKKFNESSDTLVIIVELTTECNLNCKYCCQHNWTKRHIIDKTTMNQLINYIRNCLTIHTFSTVRLDFIGGEPLLAMQQIKYLYDNVLSICNDYNISLLPGLDTNGTLLNYNFVKYFHNMNMSITLSCEEDHNEMRPYKNNSPTFKTIVNNILDCKNIFDNDNYKLNIRYNTTDKNFKEFSKFLDLIKSLGVQIYRIEPMYCDEYPYNSFKNNLSKQDFIDWNSSEAIDLLIKHNQKISFFPQNNARVCKAYQPFNCKVFANGQVGLCDSWVLSEKDPYIKDFSNNPRLLNDYFKKYKSWNPLNDQECSQCNHLIMCMGKYFCKNSPCDYEHYNLKNYITKYIEYQEKGLQKFFPPYI